MALPLSQNVEKAIEKLFSIENKKEVGKLLTEKCSDNISGCEFNDVDEMEDIRFQVLKLSEGNIDKLYEAVQLANEDFRNLAINVGSLRKFKLKLLGADLKPTISSDQQMYEQHVTIMMIIAAFLSSLFLHVANASIVVVAGVTFSIASVCMVRNILSAWKDTRFRKYSGVKDVLSLTILATFWNVCIPAVVGYFIVKVFKFVFF